MKRLIILISTLWLVVACFANKNEPDTYYYQRAKEELGNANYDKARSFLNKELRDNHKSGYAWYLLGGVNCAEENYGEAISNLTEALKWLPKSDRYMLLTTYYTLGRVYAKIDQLDESIANYTKANEIDQSDADVLVERAKAYLKLKEYDKAYADYQKALSVAPGNVEALIGLGQQAYDDDDFDKAYTYFDKAVRYLPIRGIAYAWRAKALMGQHQYDKAARDLAKALSLDGDEIAADALRELAGKAYSMLEPHLRVLAIKDPTETLWPLTLALANVEYGDFQQAFKYINQCLEIEDTPSYKMLLADAYIEIDNSKKALEIVNDMLAEDSTECALLKRRAAALELLGDYEGAQADFDMTIDLCDDDDTMYYSRAMFNIRHGNYDAAIDDINLALAIDDNDMYYLARGNAYKLAGDTASANSDFREVLSRDKRPLSDVVSAYAAAHLGQRDQVDSFISRKYGDPSYGEYYDMACLYAVLGDNDAAINALEKSCEKGLRRLSVMDADFDLAPLRQMPRYQALHDKYVAVLDDEFPEAATDSAAYEDVVVEVPFTKANGVAKVKCEINGLPLHFVFDTGASDVTISSVEATFMLKNDYLRREDIVGRQNYMNANGEISEGTVINLREVDFGGVTLDNVKASVISSQNAPLLLGQTVLQKLGKIEIDNVDHVLRITYKRQIEE